jgi:hypothetical protein
MGNGNWVCFNCRETVRRPTQYSGQVPCPGCGRNCTYLGTKIAVPSKRSVKAWKQLRELLIDGSLAAQERAWTAHLRARHKLEKEIANLELQLRKEGRVEVIRLLRKRLAFSKESLRDCERLYASLVPKLARRYIPRPL